MKTVKTKRIDKRLTLEEVKIVILRNSFKRKSVPLSSSSWG